jgi:hypothetical protein
MSGVIDWFCLSSTISTRRFLDRPVSVVFGATGYKLA